jgi:Zn-dependent protease
MRGGFRLGRIAGIEIRVDWSLAIIFGLILLSLGGGVFAAWHPDWSRPLVWFVALLAALAFFLSVLLHELAHAIVGRMQGAEVPRITLFVFGGMAHMEREPKAWKGELVMAIVGPLTSLAIGIACLIVGGFIAGSLDLDQEPTQILAQLGPTSTLLLWLGQINILLGLFNLVPDSNQRVFPVMRGDEFLGLVCLEDLRRVPGPDRDSTRVADVMTPRERLVGLAPADSADEALRRLSSAGVNQLPVLQDNRLRGFGNTRGAAALSRPGRR